MRYGSRRHKITDQKGNSKRRKVALQLQSCMLRAFPPQATCVSGGCWLCSGEMCVNSKEQKIKKIKRIVVPGGNSILLKQK